MLSTTLRQQLEEGIAEEIIVANVSDDDMAFVAKHLNRNPVRTVLFTNITAKGAQIFSKPLGTNNTVRTLEIAGLLNEGAISIAQGLATNTVVASVTLTQIVMFNIQEFMMSIRLNRSVAHLDLGTHAGGYYNQIAMREAIIESRSPNIVRVYNADDQLKNYCAGNVKEAQRIIDDLENHFFACTNRDFAIKLATRRNAVEWLYRQQVGDNRFKEFLGKIEYIFQRFGSPSELMAESTGGQAANPGDYLKSFADRLKGDDKEWGDIFKL